MFSYIHLFLVVNVVHINGSVLKVAIGVFCILQEDIELETGEYFLSEKRKSAKIWQEKQEKQAQKVAENKRKREEAFIPPKV